MPDADSPQVEFDLSPARIAQLASLVDDAATDATGWHDVSASLKALDTPMPADVEALVVAFDYFLRELSGDPIYGPRITMGNTCYPMPLASLPASVTDLWGRVAEVADSAVARARLYDLLYVLNRHSRHRYVESACLAYLEVGGRDSWIGLHRAEALIRMLDISREMRRDDFAEQATEKIIENARESISGTGHEPGVSLRLIGRLMREKSPPKTIDELLALARKRYQDDPFIESDVAKMQRRRAGKDVELRRALDREIVEIWIRAANGTDGLARMAHLEKAVEYARDHGQADLAKTATRLMQDIRLDDLGLQSFGASIELSQEQIAEWVGHFAEPDDWRTGLLRYGCGESGNPPFGTAEQNNAQVEMMRSEAPFYSMLRAVIVGGDGLPRWKPQNDDDLEQQKLVKAGTFRLQVVAPLYACALTEIGRRHDPLREDLVEFLSSFPAMSNRLAAVLSDGLMRFWCRDYWGCAHIVVPAIEAIARNLARSIDEPVYSVQRQNTPGKYVGLPILFRILRDHGLSESWFQYFQALFCLPYGWNYRNELAHGFVDEVSGPIAALILQAALHLTLLIPAESEVRDGDGSEGTSSPG